MSDLFPGSPKQAKVWPSSSLRSGPRTFNLSLPFYCQQQQQQMLLDFSHAIFIWQRGWQPTITGTSISYHWTDQYRHQELLQKWRLHFFMWSFRRIKSFHCASHTVNKSMPVQEYSIASPARAAVLKTLKKTKRDKAKGKRKKEKKAGIRTQIFISELSASSQPQNTRRCRESYIVPMIQMALKVMPARQMAESRDWICSCTNNYKTKCFIFFSNPGWQASLKISKWTRPSRTVCPICFSKVYLNVHCTLRSMTLIMSVQQFCLGYLKRTRKNFLALCIFPVSQCRTLFVNIFLLHPSSVIW